MSNRTNQEDACPYPSEADRRRLQRSREAAIIEKLTDAMVNVEGEATRPVTSVTIEDVASGECGTADKALHTGDVVGMRAAAQ